MNETDILREQLSTERRHSRAVVLACRAAIDVGVTEPQLEQFARACAAYLIFVTSRLLAQDQAHAAQLRARLDAAAADAPAVLDGLAVTLATRTRLLSALQLAERERVENRSSVASFIRAARDALAGIEPDAPSSEPALAALLEEHYTITEWRAAAFATADAILEERRLYKLVRAQLPPGIDLSADEGEP
ncbi:MAG TPA: hypothetical protein VF315_00960 [Steroidobacteraceae bacterium]